MTEIKEDHTKIISILESWQGEYATTNLLGRSFYAKCVNVMDGDTIELAMLIHDGHTVPVVYKCRMFGIDCPEIHTTDQSEKTQGMICKEVVEKLILGKIVWVKFTDGDKDTHNDKYGRQLGKVYILQSVSTANTGSSKLTAVPSEKVCGIRVPHTMFVNVDQESIQTCIRSRKGARLNFKLLCVNDFLLKHTDTCEYYGGKKMEYKSREHKHLGKKEEGFLGRRDKE
jgi:hypothetical protein